MGKARIRDNFIQLAVGSSFEMVFVKVSLVFFKLHGLWLNKLFWREFSKAGEEKQFFRLVFRNVNSRGTTAGLWSIASRSKSELGWHKQLLVREQEVITMERVHFRLQTPGS